LAEYKEPNNRDKKGRNKLHETNRELPVNPEFGRKDGDNPKPNGNRGAKIKSGSCRYCNHKIVFNIGREMTIKGPNVLHTSQNGRISKKCYEPGCECDKPSRQEYL
jgi:hypothetical protein